MSSESLENLADGVGWIELAGAVNVRDLGGLATSDGRRTRPHRLIRADNLQDLTAADVRYLVDTLGVRTVADLRSDVEIASEGPGPMTREPEVHIERLSLFPDSADVLPSAAGPDQSLVLPWQNRVTSGPAAVDPSDEDADVARRRGVYVGYLQRRPDSVLAALRAIADSPGATIVHCAAGKDRTGVVIALALSEVGVERAEIVADYARTAERIRAIFDRLLRSKTYAADVGLRDLDAHTPRATTMERMLDVIDTDFGGVPAWLRSVGWTDVDAAALRTKLLS